MANVTETLDRKACSTVPTSSVSVIEFPGVAEVVDAIRAMEGLIREIRAISYPTTFAGEVALARPEHLAWLQCRFPSVAFDVLPAPKARFGEVELTGMAGTLRKEDPDYRECIEHWCWVYRSAAVPRDRRPRVAVIRDLLGHDNIVCWAIEHCKGPALSSRGHVAPPLIPTSRPHPCPSCDRLLPAWYRLDGRHVLRCTTCSLDTEQPRYIHRLLRLPPFRERARAIYGRFQEGLRTHLGQFNWFREERVREANERSAATASSMNRKAPFFGSFAGELPRHARAALGYARAKGVDLEEAVRITATELRCEETAIMDALCSAGVAKGQDTYAWPPEAKQGHARWPSKQSDFDAAANRFLESDFDDLPPSLVFQEIVDDSFGHTLSVPIAEVWFAEKGNRSVISVVFFHHGKVDLCRTTRLVRVDEPIITVAPHEARNPPTAASKPVPPNPALRRPLLRSPAEHDTLARLREAHPFDHVVPNYRLADVIDVSGLIGFGVDEIAYLRSCILDFVVIDVDGLPIKAVETQKGGHHDSPEWVWKDSVKRRAVLAAGLAFEETF
ncbi:hypothetical protein [Azospirillum argentinense]